jgi:hypothetical protein
MCALSLDFHSAFDRIAHDYLFHILQCCGIRPNFIDHLRAMYSDATASVQINDTIAGIIPIQSGVRQGCPMSMALYALCLHPLLSMLDHSLQGVRVGPGKRCRPVLAYADDVTVFVTHPAEFTKIHQAIHKYEKATGAQLNPTKSKTMALSGWTVPATELGVPFHDRIKVLCITFGPTIPQTMTYSWTGEIHAFRAQALKAYTRTLCFAQRIRYVQLCLLAKIWYMAQIVPLNTAHAQQIRTICTWFLWQLTIFRIPLTTLQRTKEDGGWDIPNISAKCRTLLYNRMQKMGEQGGTVISQQMRRWDLTAPLANPPNGARIPSKLVHMRQYVMDMAYVRPYTAEDTRNVFRHRIYDALRRMDEAKNGTTELTILKKIPRLSLAANMDKPPRSPGDRNGKIGVVCGHPRHCAYK